MATVQPAGAEGPGRLLDDSFLKYLPAPLREPRRAWLSIATGWLLSVLGSLVLAAPDAGSFWRRGMGRRWPSFKLPEHVLYFDRHTLGRLMAESGLVDLAPVPYPHAFPLPLVASKLGWRLPRTLQGINLWLPATTVAVIGTKPHA